MDFDSFKITIDSDDTLLDLLRDAYGAGWSQGYKEKGFEFDWIDEEFSKYVKEKFRKEQ
jgi:hypothetical protein